MMRLRYLATIGLSVFFGMGISEPSSAAPANVDKAFARLRYAADGKPFRFDRYRGKVVYVNFFASWCPPCNREASTIAALARTYAPQGLVVIGIDEGEDAAHAMAFRKRYDLPYSMVLDSEGSAQSFFGDTVLPMSIFFDRQGSVAEMQTGMLDATSAASTLDVLLGKAQLNQSASASRR